MPAQPYRYAVYFCPKPQTPLGRFGQRWLENAKIAMTIGLMEKDYFEITQSPRRYGFHGTLKPPFRLADGIKPEALMDSVAGLAASMPPVELSGFNVKAIGDFLALVPRGPSDELSNLANRCVTELDRFRAELTADELARRRQTHLSPVQDQLLQTWGYPYVIDEFRFHLTLTDTAPEGHLNELIAGMTDAAGDALGRYIIDDICLMAELSPGAPFELLYRFPLGGV